MRRSRLVPLLLAILTTALSVRAQKVSSETNKPLSDSAFKGLGMFWLLEMIAEPARHCAERGAPGINFRLRLNRLGQVKVVELFGANESAKQCLLLLAQPHPQFSDDVLAVDTKLIRIPWEERERDDHAIVCEIPLRGPQEPGKPCEELQDCGAGQACMPVSAAAPELDGGQPPVKRCVDFQRWLTANGAQQAAKRSK